MRETRGSERSVPATVGTRVARSPSRVAVLTLMARKLRGKWPPDAAPWKSEDAPEGQYFCLLPSDAGPLLDLDREMIEKYRPGMGKFYLNKKVQFQ